MRPPAAANSRFSKTAGTACRTANAARSSRWATKKHTAADHKTAGSHLDNFFKDGIEITFGAGIEDTKLHPEIAGRFLRIRSLRISFVGIVEKRHDGRLTNHLM